jgi:carboxypeptidase C (cathepsin A)
MVWLLFALALTATAGPPSHLVTNLPGIGNLPMEMYSGYLQIPNSGNKELHYVLYASQNNPKTDPLVLWLNGGPGCSSMEGAFMENGPYIFSETNSTMFANPYTWNKNASMLYLEAPAGVGYSMLGSLSNNNTNDNQTASDNLQALFQWFSYFPEYKTNTFYIAGESYAGIYVPLLAYYIQQSNSNVSNPQINLKGILVGNGVTNWNVDAYNIWPQFLYWHQLIDDSIYVPWVNSNCTVMSDMSEFCESLYGQMEDLFTDVNFYDIYRECIHPNYQAAPHKARWSSRVLTGILNCVPDNALVVYLNSPKVRNALHINSTIGAWEECTDLNYSPDYARGSFVYYPSLIASGININIYSGDTDSAVPTTGTRTWLSMLDIPTAVNWTEWYLNQQVAGFFIRYGSNLRFNTIRGAGHMCIQWKPAQGYQMFLNFIQGKDFV